MFDLHSGPIGGSKALLSWMPTTVKQEEEDSTTARCTLDDVVSFPSRNQVCIFRTLQNTKTELSSNAVGKVF